VAGVSSAAWLIVAGLAAASAGLVGQIARRRLLRSASVAFESAP
jgi:hypothetical protein